MKTLFNTHKKAEVEQPAMVPVTPEFIWNEMSRIHKATAEALINLSVLSIANGHHNMAESAMERANRNTDWSFIDYDLRADIRIANSVQENA